MQAALEPHPSGAMPGNLRAIFARRGFRRLLLIRVLSQLGDGWFQAGLAGSVLFNPERATKPVAIAMAFAVLLLPYSSLGPFVGVFLDRWSRRSTLLVANALRAVLVVPACLFVWHGQEGPIFVLMALGVIAFNRFFLSGLLASQPHVVDSERLVTANSFTTTVGTVVYTIGLGTAGLIFHFTGTGFHPYAAVAAVAAIAYALSAALTGVSFRRADLGPDDTERATDSVTSALRATVTGMVAGLRHLRRRPAARTMLLVHAGQRGLYGVLAITTLLLYRNYYAADTQASVTGLLPVAAAGALGALAAAVITPPAARRFGGWQWVTIMIGAIAVLIPVLGLPYLQVLTVTAVFAVSVVTQGTKIVTDTTLQLEVDDDYRGRIFSVNDTAYNVAFVSGLFIGAATLKATGHSPAVMLGAAAGYGLLAAWYGLSSARTLARRP
jgi:MFS family permease